MTANVCTNEVGRIKYARIVIAVRDEKGFKDSGSTKEKAFEEEFPKLPIRNDKKKDVDCIHDKERQKNKFSVLTDVEDDIEEIKIMKDKKMMFDQQE
ncbi:hypothetical protein Tco_0110774 [Tanacetum coccineum]